MLDAVKKYRVLFLASVFVLFISFTFNFFGANGGADWFRLYQKDSEILVANKLTCNEALGQDSLDGMLGASINSQNLNNDNFNSQIASATCNKEQVGKYYSQYGLQGKIYQLGYDSISWLPGISLARYLLLAQIVTAAITAIILSMFVLWVAREFNKSTAVVVLLLLAWSVWIIGFAKNLYWATPLFFLPFVYTLFYFKEYKLKLALVFYAGLYVLFVARFLSGYEYTPEVILAPVVAVAYIIHSKKSYYRRLALESLKICIVGVLSFSTALGLHYHQVYNSTNNSAEALSIIKNRIVERTGDPSKYRGYAYAGLYVTAPQVYKTLDMYVDLDSRAEEKPAFQTDVLSAINYAMLPAISIPLVMAQPFATFMNSMLFMAILGYIGLRNLSKKSGLREKNKTQISALQKTYWFSLLASISWLILAHSHSLVHAHINGIIFYLPFLLFVYIIIGLWISKYINLIAKLMTSKKV